jgi:aerobic-type carbon monoxide dehydrogenase small subunit (CoxS/CutS family)
MSGEDLDDEFDLRCTLNGREVERRTAYSTTLAELVREDFGLTGTKVSCDEQICGACTLLVDDRPVSACTFLAYDARGRSVLTIEGLADPDGELHPLQQAFLDAFAFQCGFCTPGMIMSALGLLRTSPHADRDEIVDHLDGNLCRCTGYLPILAAVEQAQAALAPRVAP